MTFTTFVLWLHLTLVVVWVGGFFAVGLVVVPVLRSGADSPQAAARLAGAAIQRFGRISREIVFLIFLSGVFNVINAGMPRSFRFGAEYMSTLGVKVALFAAVVTIHAWQSLRLAPALTATATSGERAEPTARLLYRRLTWTSLAGFAIAVTVVLLGLKLGYR